PYTTLFRSPCFVGRSLVDRNGLAPEIFELLNFRRSLPNQELEVGVEIAFGEQHVLGAFLGYRRRSSNEVVSTGLHRWEQSGILGSINRDVALQALGEFVGEVDVEPLIAATRKIWKGMRRERA